METARLGDITNAQIDAYRSLMRWVRADPNLEPWSPYLIAANAEGWLVRVLVGYAPPLGYIIIGPNCSQTGAVHRVSDLRGECQGVGPDTYQEWR